MCRFNNGMRRESLKRNPCDENSIEYLNLRNREKVRAAVKQICTRGVGRRRVTRECLKSNKVATSMETAMAR